jgi:catechol 2,3-dioxygenase-like lactoylglutathione lyase family enzyme
MAAALRCEIFPADLDATVAFYVSVLGFELVRDERDQPSAYVALAPCAGQGAAEQVAKPVTDSEEQRERNEHGQPPAHDRADRDARDQAVGT